MIAAIKVSRGSVVADTQMCRASVSLKPGDQNIILKDLELKMSVKCLRIHDWIYNTGLTEETDRKTQEEPQNSH